MLKRACALCLCLKGLEWKEKAESLEVELQQCYKAQSRLAEQLGTEVAESRSLKASLQEKDLAIESLQRELTEIRFFYLLVKYTNTAPICNVV